jgi:hypothetical protein
MLSQAPAASWPAKPDQPRSRPAAADRNSIHPSILALKSDRRWRSKTCELLNREGAVQHPGMTRPLAGDAIKSFITMSPSAMQDFRLRCARDDVLFVEAALSGTTRTNNVTWPAI